MPSVCFYFQVHQPYRIKKYRVFDIGEDAEYFNDEGEGSLNNKRILQKVAAKCYIPANQVLLELCREFPEFRASFSFSGVLLEQLALYAPEALESFQALAATEIGRAHV